MLWFKNRQKGKREGRKGGWNEAWMSWNVVLRSFVSAGRLGLQGGQQPAWGISRPELICVCSSGAGWAEAAGSRDPVPLGQKGIRRRSSRRGLNLEKTRLFSDLPRPSKSWPGKLRHSIDWAFTQNLFKTEFVHMWNGINTRDCVYGLLERWNFDEHLKVMSPVKKRQFNPIILLFVSYK